LEAPHLEDPLRKREEKCIVEVSAGDGSAKFRLGLATDNGISGTAPSLRHGRAYSQLRTPQGAIHGTSVMFVSLVSRTDDSYLIFKTRFERALGTGKYRTVPGGYTQCSLVSDRLEILT
jgi:hypothetical protein